MENLDESAGLEALEDPQPPGPGPERIGGAQLQKALEGQDPEEALALLRGAARKHLAREALDTYQRAMESKNDGVALKAAKEALALAFGEDQLSGGGSGGIHFHLAPQEPSPRDVTVGGVTEIQEGDRYE